LGPYIRRFVFHELRHDPQRMEAIARGAAPDLAARLGPALVPFSNSLTGLRYGAAVARAADQAREKVLVALERLESELGGEQYLAGGRFTVADLTAASLLYPLVLPPEAETVIQEMPESLEAFRAGLRDRRLVAIGRVVEEDHLLAAVQALSVQLHRTGRRAAKGEHRRGPAHELLDGQRKTRGGILPQQRALLRVERERAQRMRRGVSRG